MTILQASPAEAADVQAAVELGNKYSNTLGFLPNSAYLAAAERGTLLIAAVDGHIGGYALYELARGRVRLTHLCVAKEDRGHGIARLFVEAISERHPGYLGIHVRCRHDYGLGDMWIKLGFRRLSEQPGKNKEGHMLVNWWRDHGHPTLFTRLDTSVLVRAAFDLNVLRDLVDPGRSDTRDIKALIDDQITDRLELVRTGALDAEINTMDGPLRRQCTDKLQLFPSVHADQATVSKIKSQLAAAAQREHPGYPHTPQDEFDLRHVTEAIAAGLNVFVTRDMNLTKLLSARAEDDYGLRIMRPADVIVHLDELVRAEAYRPAALADTTYSHRLLGLGHDQALAALLEPPTGERPRDLARTLKELALARRDRYGLFGPNGSLLAAYSAHASGPILVVPFARVAPHALADTLARQMLFLLRQRARDAGTPTISITDRHLSRSIRTAAILDGFTATDEGLYAFAIAACDTSDTINQLALSAARQIGQIEPATLRSAMPAVAAAEIERAWWPAKLTDSALPNYLVPIQQTFSADLLGVPHTMFTRPDSLGLSREHVYYRTPGGTTPHAPGRLLWYMSGTGPSTPQTAAVIGCSQLDAVVNGTPAELHSRFRHLGVWDADQVEQAARGGQVQALLFSNTEIFPHPISRERHRKICTDHDEHPVPFQPKKIPAGLFTDLYREGTVTS